MNGYALWSILLLMGGLATLVLEIFVPSGGILAFVTVSSIVMSLVFSAMAWWTQAPILFALHLATVIILVPVCLFGALGILPRTRAGKRMLLEPPDGDKLRLQEPQPNDLQPLIGQLAVARTMLAPSGFISLEGKRYSATSESSLIEVNTRVTVVGLNGTTLVVRAEVETKAEPRNDAIGHGFGNTAGSSAPSLQPSSTRGEGVFPERSLTTPNGLPSGPESHAQPLIEKLTGESDKVELDPFSRLAAEDLTTEELRADQEKS